MNSKILISLGTAALAGLGASLYVLNSEDGGAPSDSRAGEPVLPELREHVNDVARITLESGGELLSLARQDGTWGLADKGGYPVNVDEVKALVLGLTELELIEEKTADPARFSKLDLQDPGGADAPSKRVQLHDESDALLADVIVGRANPGRGFGQSTLYVRHAAGGPALEVRGQLKVDAGATTWLDRQIAKLERKRVRAVEVTHPDGEVLRIQRETPEETDFQVLGLAEDAELSWAGVAGGIAGALEYLNLEDVESADSSPVDAAEAVTARFSTFDGLVVTMRTMERDGNVLLAVSAEYDEAARAAGTAGPPEEGAEGEPTPPPGKTPEEVTAEAGEINARVGGWTYVVPGYAGANLRKRLDDLLKKDEPPAPDDPTAGGVPAEFLEPFDPSQAEEPAAGEEPAAEGGEVPEQPAPAGGGEPEQPAPAGGGEPEQPAGEDPENPLR